MGHNGSPSDNVTCQWH